MSETESKVEIVNEGETVSTQEVTRPIVLRLKKSSKKKVDDGEKKPKYTRGLKDIQVFEGEIVKIVKKTSKGLSKSVDVYDQERQKSAREKTDGAIEDYIQNTAKASSAYLKETADIPIDVAEAITSNQYGKRLRRNLRRASKNILFWRI